VHVALISEHASPLAAIGGVDAGGQNVHVAELASGLVRLRHTVTVYTRRDGPGPERITTSGGYDVVHVPAGPARSLPKDDLWAHMPEFAHGLRQRLAAEPPAVIHTHFWMSAWAGAEASAALDVPLVVTYHALGSVKQRHQGSADTSPKERIRVEAEVGQSADRIVATCHDEVLELSRLGIPRRKVSIVPCGVDVKQFVGAEDGFRPDRSGRYEHRLLSVGRLVPRKGFDTVIEALQELPGAELLIAGGAEGADEPERDRLLRLARRLRLDERVRLVGQVPHLEMPALLQSADVVICAPWYEPFGIVPLEAMACGVPVVASAVGGLQDTVADSVTGLLVPPRNPSALATAVKSLLEDPQRRAAYGRAGRERVERRYTWSRVAAATANAYAQVVRARDKGERILSGGYPRGSASSEARRSSIAPA
jgi:D-inositol-3-phosphate glycosyltransferase